MIWHLIRVFCTNDIVNLPQVIYKGSISNSVIKNCKNNISKTCCLLQWIQFNHNQEEPNSVIHLTYLSKSVLDTDLLHLLRASLKSCMETGRSRSSRPSCLICSGFRPAILRRIDIMDASLKHQMVEWQMLSWVYDHWQCLCINEKGSLP